MTDQQPDWIIGFVDTDEPREPFAPLTLEQERDIHAVLAMTVEYRGKPLPETQWETLGDLIRSLYASGLDTHRIADLTQTTLHGVEHFVRE